MPVSEKNKAEKVPTCYNDGKIEVFTNSQGEVFVVDLVTKTTLRIKQHVRGGLAFTTKGRVELEPVADILKGRITKRS
ncbi:MAG: hypothetical protein V4668_04310 [Patescibacteria group bacterium]